MAGNSIKYMFDELFNNKQIHNGKYTYTVGGFFKAKEYMIKIGQLDARTPILDVIDMYRLIDKANSVKTLENQKAIIRKYEK